MNLIRWVVVVVLAYAVLVTAFLKLGRGHDEAPWLATYVNSVGTPCCTGGNDGDCARVSHEQAWTTGIGGYIDIELRGETRRVLINTVIATQDPQGQAWACLPGCLARAAGY